jgi:hypothetical protein
MPHALFASVDEMLDPDTLSALGAASVRDVRCVPVRQPEAYSGSSYSIVETNGRAGPRYFLKRTPPAKDPAIPGSFADLNRTVAVWQHGILNRLPPNIDHAIVACSHDGAGYAILMRDVSETLMPGDKRFSVADHALFLDSMTAMHAAFWEDPRLSDSLLGMGHPAYFGIDPAAEGWAFVEELLEPDVAHVVRSLLQNPGPLYDALARYPATLVHNDLWWANLGIIRGEHPRVIMLDWDFVALAPPAVDLVQYIGENFWVLPRADEAAVEEYRSSLARRLGARFDEGWWLPQLDLCLLGDFMRRSKWILLAISRATNDQERAQHLERLVWWSGAVRRGARWL